ncbi:hypothetical protein C8A05DRAFT_34093 [Staphylotrichum tortipilum]|uniref:Uncharacterized protein n=1 Tax=Staphylotrichum tortipilum TaxID=2831512 RepID=A0AAN6MJV5_9PEZI|nr:hypothetical protein C8A05DRAFT_34093 [Staphylotrichum longicolle]
MDERSAVERFAANAVVLRVLAEQIRAPRHLRDLCLVSRFFHSEFIVYLYRELDTPIERLRPANPHVVHTRSLVARSCAERRDNDHDAFNEVAQGWILKMPLLETFFWPDPYDLRKPTMELLRKSCPRIKGIHLDYLNTDGLAALYFPRPGPIMRTWHHNLSAFKNLESLTLNHLGGSLPAWRAHLAQVLMDSPNLKALDLSLSGMTIRQMYPGPEYDLRWFDRLCDDYGTRGGVPLKLRSLRCGHAVFPLSHSSLTRLVDLAHLEEVDICNKNVNWGGRTIEQIYRSRHSRSGITFESFGPRHCPRLRRFSAHRYGEDVYEYLRAVAAEPAFARQLAVCIAGMGSRSTGDSAVFFKASPKHPGFPLRPRMVEVELNREKIEWFAHCDATGTPAKTIFDVIANSNGTNLEGLTLQMHNEQWSARFLELPSLEPALRRMSRLKQLAYNPFVASRQALGRAAQAGVPREIVLGAAHRFATAAPALEYVGMYRQFWRVKRHDNGYVEMVELQRSEWRAVELFYQSCWNLHRFPNWGVPDSVDWPNLYQAFE